MTNKWNAPPAMEIDTKKTYTARMETDKGEMVIELFADKAPKTVNNFVFLSRQGFYDGIIFHRVIANFMAQGGDPTGTGTSGPGYKFEDEFDPSLRHDKPGVLSMANAEHKRLAIFHHARSHPPPGRQAQCLWPGQRGHGCTDVHSAARPDATGVPRCQNRESDY